MTITRINTFQAKPGNGSKLKAALSELLPVLNGADGFHSCNILQGADDPENIVIIESWRSSDDHKAAASQIPRDGFDAVMAMLAGPPTGSYFTE